MKAVILGAGLSNRLCPLTDKVPKCLLKIGRKSLLEYALDNFVRLGIRNIVIVTGHGGKEVKKSINNSFYNNIKIKFVFNPEYAVKNNVYSLWCVRNELTDGFILFNSDVLCDPMIIQKVVDSKIANLLVIDDTKKLGKEEMKVKIENGQIVDISKELACFEADGEYIGIAKFSREGGTLLSSILDWFIERNKVDVFYEAAFQKMVSDYNIYVLSTQRLPWIEIDDFTDLEKARKSTVAKLRKKYGTII